MTNQLGYFRVDGAWRDVEQPIPGNTGTIVPQINDVSAYIDFFPGLISGASIFGLTALVPNYDVYGDTEIALAPITVRIIDGKLCSITKQDPIGVELVANLPWMDLGVDLYYHVRYRNVTYGGALQRFSNFAFKAPTDTTTSIRLTSTSLARVDYNGPLT